jgi:hypothetical protein
MVYINTFGNHKFHGRHGGGGGSIVKDIGIIGIKGFEISTIIMEIRQNSGLTTSCSKMSREAMRDKGTPLWEDELW